eukprot:CAMPEP_0172588792 /NCGR_PEP_ID=MMETSP1068-20121228/7645_1 /TAXON_ID=35684 /ORGANISM="Pseudopedinella elastica, Strain CCMP716" /LENGTH=191 /DNA_ID=CAMNT_0013384229 /DNA_START=32 /DNA_END=607 /DNA_ORIENTATION=+
MVRTWEKIAEQEAYKEQLEKDIAAKAMELSDCQEKYKHLEDDMKELEGGTSELLNKLRADLKEKISEHSTLKETSKNLNETKADLEKEVADLEKEAAELEAQLATDAEVNAQQLQSIKELTATAAADTEELDSLEAQCLELSNELKDKEAVLKNVQEMERKCSREYIAYEKAKAKSQKAKEVKKKDPKAWA